MGEPLTPDAKSIIGQKPSRFPDEVDGPIGQGLRVLLPVMANEEIRARHPAVARPGRRAATIELERLSGQQAAGRLDRSPSRAAAFSPRSTRRSRAFDPARPRPFVGFAE